MGLEEVIFLGGGELLSKGFFWVAWEGEVWSFLKIRRLRFFWFSKNFFFGDVGWGDWRKGWVYIFFSFFFHNKVI